jgi:MFS family permease
MAAGLDSTAPATVESSELRGSSSAETVAEPTSSESRPRRTRLRPVRLAANIRTFDAFHYRDYRLLWGVTAFSSAGYWLQLVLVGWLTYDLTQSAFITSLALGLDALPILVAGPLGGLLADSWDKRKLLSAILVYQVVVTTGFAAIVLLDLAATWNIFGFVMLMGIGWIGTDPARMSLIPKIVPKNRLVNAFALNSMAFSATRLGAPVIGGILLATVGAGPAFFLEVGFQVMALAMAVGLRVPDASRKPLHIRSALSEILEAVHYARSEPIILGVLLFGVIPSVLVIPFVQGLMPVYAAEVFGVGPTGLGLLLSAVGVGSLISTFVLASIREVEVKGRLVLLSAVIMGVGLVLFSRNSSYALAFPCLIFVSSGMVMFFTTSIATIQTTVRDDLRGRVAGLYMVTWGLFPFGSLAAGSLADRYSAPTATLVAAGALAIVFVLLALRFRVVWRFHQVPEGEGAGQAH